MIKNDMKISAIKFIKKCAELFILVNLLFAQIEYYRAFRGEDDFKVEYCRLESNVKLT